MCEVCECMVGSRRKVCMKDECKESKYIYMNPDGRMRRGVCVYVEGGRGMRVWVWRIGLPTAASS